MEPSRIPERIRDLPGLGPQSEKMLQRIQIETPEQFLAADPFELFARLKKQDASISLNLLYAMLGAQENCHWRDIAVNRRTEILMRLDDLKLL